MTFNSFPFLAFLAVVFTLYWCARPSLRLQNLVLLAASYFFYGWWDWRFLGLILLSSVVDYSVGLALGRSRTPRSRRLLLGLSLATNLGLLGFFKYYGFFVDSFARLFGIPEGQLFTLHIILPVGISFYTFQTLSYTIDIYRRQIEPTRDALSFFAFVSFFPQLVAGPIERASHLLPQFEEERTFTYDDAADGMRQMLWGLFKKVVIANSCAAYVNVAFETSRQMPGSTLLLCVALFSFQIYADFSGYSDIAIGCARLFGFRLMRNFAYPYFSRDIGEFWRRWHISLSSWFRDYVYIPLGGNRVSRLLNLRNVLAVFLLSGLWHGANWTFVVWGLVHALYFIPSFMRSEHRRFGKPTDPRAVIPSPSDVVRMGWTFLLATLAWIPFRADTLDHTWRYLRGILQPSLFSIPRPPFPVSQSATLLASLGILVIVEWLQRNREHGLEIHFLPTAARWSAYVALLLIIFFLGSYNDPGFIYFQF